MTYVPVVFVRKDSVSPLAEVRFDEEEREGL
jgi:hypothetical protein